MNNWTPNTPPPEVAEQMMADARYYTVEALLRATKRTRFRDLENQRRQYNQAYRVANEHLSGTTRRTYNIQEMEDYARARVQAHPVMVQELLSVHRSYQRRIRYRYVQRNITNMVHKVFGEPSRKQRHWSRKYGQALYEMCSRRIQAFYPQKGEDE